MGDLGIFYDGNSYPMFPQEGKEKPGRGRDIVSSRPLFISSVRSLSPLKSSIKMVAKSRDWLVFFWASQAGHQIIL